MDIKNCVFVEFIVYPYVDSLLPVYVPDDFNNPSQINQIYLEILKVLCQTLLPNLKKRKYIPSVIAKLLK